MNEKQNKVLLHPEKDEIISRLLNGESVKSVEKWLKDKHPKRKRLHISSVTLQAFRKNFLNLEGEVLGDIQAAKKEKEVESIDLEAKAILATSDAYQKKLNEIVSMSLDGNRKILEMSVLISSRMEYYFNMLSDPDLKVKVGVREDKMFLELVAAQRELVRDWKKFVEGVADQKIDHNINITVVNEQLTILKNIIFEVLQELDPVIVPYFIEKVNSRLLDVQYGNQKYESYQNNKYLDVIDAE